MPEQTSALVQPEAVIFDLDGTLLDTLEDIAAAMNAALVSLGYPTATIDQVRTRVGWGLHRLVVQSVPPDMSPEDVDTVVEATRAYYRDHPVVHTVPYDGVPGFLKRLTDRPIPCAVLSNKPDELVQPIVSHCLPDVPFVHVAGQRSDVPRKPDPASTRFILEQMNVPAHRTVFVGDSDIDMQTARAAGCIPMAVAWGFRDAASLQAAGAEHICYSVDQLERLLGLEAKRNVSDGLGDVSGAVFAASVGVASKDADAATVRSTEREKEETR